MRVPKSKLLNLVLQIRGHQSEHTDVMIQRKGDTEWIPDTREEHWILSQMIFHPKKVWPWAHHVSSQNHVSQMRMGVMSPALHVSQGWWDPIRGSMGTRKLSGKMNVPFRPAGIQLSDRVGSRSSIPHFRCLVLQPGSQEGGWIACSRARTLIVLEPAIRKKLGRVVMCQFQMGRQLCFLHKKPSLGEMGWGARSPILQNSIQVLEAPCPFSPEWCSSDFVRMNFSELQGTAATPPSAIAPSALAKVIFENARTERS